MLMRLTVCLVGENVSGDWLPFNEPRLLAFCALNAKKAVDFWVEFKTV